MLEKLGGFTVGAIPAPNRASPSQTKPAPNRRWSHVALFPLPLTTS